MRQSLWSIISDGLAIAFCLEILAIKTWIIVHLSSSKLLFFSFLDNSDRSFVWLVVYWLFDATTCYWVSVGDYFYMEIFNIYFKLYGIVPFFWGPSPYNCCGLMALSKWLAFFLFFNFSFRKALSLFLTRCHLSSVVGVAAINYLHKYCSLVFNLLVDWCYGVDLTGALLRML